jgi:Tesmin/TSO1-like CXC domain, cysteine-rich domain
MDGQTKRPLGTVVYANLAVVTRKCARKSETKHALKAELRGLDNVADEDKENRAEERHSVPSGKGSGWVDSSKQLLGSHVYTITQETSGGTGDHDVPQLFTNQPDSEQNGDYATFPQVINTHHASGLSGGTHSQLEQQKVDSANIIDTSHRASLHFGQTTTNAASESRKYLVASSLSHMKSPLASNASTSGKEVSESLANDDDAPSPSLPSIDTSIHSPDSLPWSSFKSPSIASLGPTRWPTTTDRSRDQSFLASLLCHSPIDDTATPNSSMIPRSLINACGFPSSHTYNSDGTSHRTSEAPNCPNVNGPSLDSQWPTMSFAIANAYAMDYDFSPGLAKAVRSNVAYQTEQCLLRTTKVATKPCRCKNTHCLKLYCACFKAGILCNPDVCICTGCKNAATENSPGSDRARAVRDILDRRLDAFEERNKRKMGGRCSCKKNR